EDLVPVPYDGSTLVNRRQRVTLANRYRWTVRLHRPNFMKMNQGNRVALLIHEALFSMLRPESEGGALHQQPFRIREMVATLFSPPERGARWRSSFDDALVIPEVGFRRSCQVGEQALLWSTEGDRKRPFELSETDWRSRFGEVARSICMRSGDEIVELVFTRPGFRAVELSFLQSRGTAEHRQVYLGFIPVAARFSWKGRLPRLAEEPRVCEAFLRGLANPWYGYDPGTFSTDSLYACEMPRP
ncbi:MAG TPA: hypothetical protein PL182_11405, partial [Pseudobdellovibrionaceae bacterium]|nr:hypothetical protein [Pseudobdellovibrionaceae bacterium]